MKTKGGDIIILQLLTMQKVHKPTNGCNNKTTEALGVFDNCPIANLCMSYIGTKGGSGNAANVELLPFQNVGQTNVTIQIDT